MSQAAFSLYLQHVLTLLFLFHSAAVLEATGEIEEALIAFQRAEKLGIERAKTNIRNVSNTDLVSAQVT